MNIRLIGNLLIVAATVLPVNSVLAADANVTPIPAENGPAPNTAVCYVIGDVQFPGAFEFQSSPMVIDTLLKRAGGLDSSEASCEIQIVRAGRVVHHADYQFTKNATHCRLKSGDVVIATKKESQFPSAAARKKASSANANYVGLVGILETPIILPIFSSDVTVGRLLAELRQSPGMANQIRIITSGDADARRPIGQALRSLTNGMVLVFDPQNIDFATLPKIPAVAAMPDSADRGVQLVSQETAEPVTGPELFAEPVAPLDHQAGDDVNLMDEQPAVAELGVESGPEIAIAAPTAAEATTTETSSAPAENNWTPVIGALLIAIGLIWMLRDHRERVSRWMTVVPGKTAIAGTARKLPVLMTVARGKLPNVRLLPKKRSTAKQDALTMNRAGKLVHRVLFRVARQRD
ncbi:hypothetical protein [Symmachiella dynata]|uniref:hypothetical protein n=1 Tax=Symmachiella dynata TaxID=2527995 RepID=UPI0030EF7DBF